VFRPYFNNRNFTVDPSWCAVSGASPSRPPAGAAIESEGVSFVPASRSASGHQQLVVNHELSDTVSVYDVELLLR
jgi:hypothetical protein